MARSGFCLSVFVASLSTISCAGSDQAQLKPFSWQMAWRMGDRFEIVRIEDAHITPAALNLKHEDLIPEFGWKTRLVFHATVTGIQDGSLKLELVVASAQTDGIWGSNKSSTAYERAKGQRDGSTGEPQEIAKEYLRTYTCTVDPRGIMKDWEGRLEAMACLHGLGGEYYNVFTSLLLELPHGVIPWGHTWSTDSAVKLAHCDQVPFKLACRLERDGAGSEDGYPIVADAFLADDASPHLGKPGTRLGSGRWLISRDQRSVQGIFALDLINAGKSTVRWRDEVRIAPLRN